MYVLITYDVDTISETGQKRLRNVAKACKDYGQRVQNSVFECLLDASQYVIVKAALSELIDPETDSIRFYRLGNNYKNQIEQIGKTMDYSQDGLLIL